MKEALTTNNAPTAIGPYSQAVRARGFLFLSGQIPLDPRTGAIVSGGIEAEVQRVLDSLGGVLEAAGSTFADVVRTTIYLVDLADFSVVNEFYSRRFKAPFPARSTVQVAALPRGAQIEIDAIAIVRD